ncbi:MAG TPA: hypothetical protein VMP12_03225, partial [Candidatus Sulfotelmatobacter sp.]|nr:hypothetical protein [Candidatus Sulfotelmatobacter sp.]
MGILLEVAIDTVHAFFQMDVREMDRFAEFRRVVGRDDFIFSVEQIPFAVSFIDRAKNPAMAVKIPELRLLQLRIEFGAADVFEEFRTRPQTTRCGAFRISDGKLISFFLAGVVLLARIHRFGIGFVVPP